MILTVELNHHLSFFHVIKSKQNADNDIFPEFLIHVLPHAIQHKFNDRAYEAWGLLAKQPIKQGFSERGIQSH